MDYLLVTIPVVILAIILIIIGCYKSLKYMPRNTAKEVKRMVDHFEKNINNNKDKTK